MMRAALLHNFPLSEFYRLRLHKVEPNRLGVFLSRRMAYGLDFVQARSRQIATANDKRRFEDHCIHHGLPTVRSIAWFGVGKEQWANDVAELPARNLFRKPWGLSSGRGAELWRFQPGENAWSCGNRLLNSGEFVEDLRKVGGLGGVMVQPALRNASDLRDIAAGGLSTIRVVTLMTQDGPAVLSATLRLPVGRMMVDNYSMGGLVVDVDLESGLLSSAFSKSMAVPLTHHPDTGGRIAGRLLPCWGTVRDLALHAHSTLPDLASAGWDIAPTEDGVLLVEANVGWNTDLLQLTRGQGMLETPYTAWANARLDALSVR